MAFGSIEITTITRTQDYTTVKHNEDNKGFMDQTNIGQQIQKQTMQRTKEVHKGDNADWYRKKSDAKEKGKNEYGGDGGSRRRREEKQEQVLIKSGQHQGFDIKI